MNVGGNLFQRFGVFYDPFSARGNAGAADLGRYTITGREDDRKVFRVPSLRNVAVTSPYFHDGSAASLAEAVDIMARSLGAGAAAGGYRPHHPVPAHADRRLSRAVPGHPLRQ